VKAGLGSPYRTLIAPASNVVTAPSTTHLNRNSPLGPYNPGSLYFLLFALLFVRLCDISYSRGVVIPYNGVHQLRVLRGLAARLDGSELDVERDGDCWCDGRGACPGEIA
jgi:hypothetical protein